LKKGNKQLKKLAIFCKNGIVVKDHFFVKNQNLNPLKSFYECENKKMTQKKTAFDIMVQLYQDGKVEPNTGRRNWGDGPSGNLLGCFAFPQHALPPPGHMLSPRDRDEYCVKMKLQESF